MPYITSIEELAKLEGETIGKARGEARGQTKGKIKVFQELLGLAIATDADLDGLTEDGRERLLIELRQKFTAR